MFCDEVKVHFIAGRGGDGCIAFRREKFVPRGGPSGGDGGDGGSIYLEADENINTLAEFNSAKIFRAKPGSKGLGSDMGGRDAEDMILPVPVGTLIFNEDKTKQLGDLPHHGDRFLIARGGRGGFGNSHFRSSTRQAPTFAELGEPGKEHICTLELKLVADVGLIGLPSVGKSTMISRISNARPKIAAYPFTTIIPNLGLVTMESFGGSRKQSFVACDLPGLIEGAHEGKGLGIQFLKHVARNRVLVHILDITSEDPSADFATIKTELKAYDKSLAKKPTLVAFNKIDAVTPEEAKKIMQAFKKKNRTVKTLFSLSCVTGEGLKPLMFAVWELLETARKEELNAKPKVDPTYTVFKPEADEDGHSFEVVKLKRQAKDTAKTKAFRVTGRRIEQIVAMTDFGNVEAVARVYDVVHKMGIERELRRNGAVMGDVIHIGEAHILYRD